MSLKSSVLAAIILATVFCNTVTIKHNGENEEPSKYKIGGKNVIILDHNINSIVVGDSSYDVELARNEQKSKKVDDMARLHSRTSPRESFSRSVRDAGLSYCQSIWSSEECQALDFIVSHESGWNQYAKNKNCCGLYQRVGRCSEEILSDFHGQMTEGMNYIKNRYGSAKNARSFWESHRWY